MLTVSAALSVLAAHPTMAQQPRQQTTCAWEFGNWVCRDTTPSTYKPPDFFEGMKKGQDYIDGLFEAQRRRQAEYEAARQAANREAEREHAEAAARQRAADDAVHAAYLQNVRNAVAKAVADGRCEDAKKLALQDAMFDLAEQAVRLCTPQ